ncbi:hypothetical protein SDJN02_23997, partial [Cucurbita argyrosperma subsp. argyrosperma]
MASHPAYLGAPPLFMFTTPKEVNLIQVQENVYARRKVISEPIQVQTSDSTHNEDATQVPIDNRPTSNSTHNEDATQVSINDRAIALRKPTGECTKRPLYPLANYISLERLSSLHK